MKNIIIIIFFLFVMLNANGQFIDNLGFKTGLSISTVKWSNGFKPDIKNRFAISNLFFLNCASHNFWSISTNFGFIQKGVNSNEKITDLQGNIILNETRINSLDFISLNIQYNLFYKIKFFKPFVNFGPSLDYLLFYNGIFENYLKEYFNKFNYNFKYSVGYDIEFKTFIIKTELINQWNLIPIIETDYTDIQIKSKIINIGLIVKI